jgi:hypothetical protein
MLYITNSTLPSATIVSKIQCENQSEFIVYKGTNSITTDGYGYNSTNPSQRYYFLNLYQTLTLISIPSSNNFSFGDNSSGPITYPNVWYIMSNIAQNL